MTGRHTGDADAGSLDGQNLGDGACDVSSVEVCNAADDEANDGADEQWLAEDAKALLHGLDVNVDVANARDLIDQPVQTHSNWCVSKREALGDRNAWHVECLLDVLCGCVSKNKQDDLVDDCCSKAKHDVVGNVCNKGADECVVPVVPDVDVDRLGGQEAG